MKLSSGLITSLTTSPSMALHKTGYTRLKVKISSSVIPSMAYFPTMTPHKTAIIKTLDMKLSSDVIPNLTTSPTMAFHKTVIQKSQLKVKISSSVIPSLAVFVCLFCFLFFFQTMTPHKTVILKTLDMKLSSGVIFNMITSPSKVFHKTVIWKTLLLSSGMIHNLTTVPNMTLHKTVI